MSFNEDGSGGNVGRGGGGGGGPWGQGPRGVGPQPPDLEELLRRGQDRLKSVMPGGISSKRGILLVLLAVVVAWVLTGVYVVDANEEGVVMRFGKYQETTQSGMHYRLPAPIESHFTPQTTIQHRMDIGFTQETTRGGVSRVRDLPEESLMLTGDENIVDIDFTVVWKIMDASNYLFNIETPEFTVKAVAESVMREVVGRSDLQDTLTEGRGRIENDTLIIMQEVLDSYQSGIEVLEVKLQKVDPPGAVINAFRDVQAAAADRVRVQNQADAYSNDVVQRAQGTAQQIFNAAEAYKQQAIAEAVGETSRYLAIYEQYKLAKNVTQRRIYLETMEEVLGGVNKIIIDGSAGGSGVVPYLPLDQLSRRGEGQ